MISQLEREVTFRFLKTRKNDGFLNIISIFSFIGISLGVAVLIIVMSVMNGFRTELISKIVGFNAHAVLQPGDKPLEYIQDLDFAKNIVSNDGEAVILNKNITKGVFLKGYLEIDFIKLVTDSSKYFGDIISRMLPPDFSNLNQLIYAMFETIEIAFLGTFIAIVLSIPLGLFSARNLAPNYFVYLICKTIVIFFRAIPEFIIAMILVIAIGFGAMPGVLALGLHTMGFLAKFYAEDIEHINKGPIDALKSSGATKSQIISFGVIPQILPSFVANNLYILDRNVRMATMLGIVGAVE